MIDFDGTLSRMRYWSPLGRQPYEAIQHFLFVDNLPLVRDWMRGKYSSEEICALAAKALALSYKTTWEALVSSCRDDDFPRWAFARLAAIRRTNCICLVTSNMDCFTRFVVPSMKLTEKFDYVFNSADMGLLKDDLEGAFFRRVSAQIGIPIKNCILIDDSASVCKLFFGLGGTPRLVGKSGLNSNHLKESKQLDLELSLA